ncbi:MAG: hypothetical protein ACREJO_04325 [Phycisphaerales bacterium]
MKLAVSSALLLALAGSAFADPVVDGTRDASYTSAATQNNQTGFGASNLGDPLYANGSALANAAYRIEGGNLYLFVGGNLESNFNKLEIFFDTGVAGQNRLRGDNADVDFNGLNRMGDSGTGNGLTFDAGFQASLYFTTTCGGSPFAMFASYAQLLPGGGGPGGYLGTTNGLGAPLSGGTNAINTLFAINNSFVDSAGGDGVLTPGQLAGYNACDTGFEMMIPLSALGNPSELRIAIMVNGSGHDFLSNQVMAGLGGSPNLGDPRNVNFNQYAGAQYITIPIPAPGAAALACLGLLVGARRRR